MIRAVSTILLEDSGLEELPAPLKAITTIGMIVLASCLEAYRISCASGLPACRARSAASVPVAASITRAGARRVHAFTGRRRNFPRALTWRISVPPPAWTVKWDRDRYRRR
jgi:hypothetical protein